MPVDAKVKRIIAEKLEVEIEDVLLEASLIDDLGADSLNVIELILGMEDIFEIEIDDEDAEKILTVKDAIDYIKSHS